MSNELNHKDLKIGDKITLSLMKNGRMVDVELEIKDCIVSSASTLINTDEGMFTITSESKFTVAH